MVRRAEHGDHGGGEDPPRADGRREEVRVHLCPPLQGHGRSQRQELDLSGSKFGNATTTTCQHKVRIKFLFMLPIIW